MADEVKHVRVVLEAVGGAQAAEDASRFKASIDGLTQAEGVASDETAALRAELERLRAQTTTLQQAQQQQQRGQADFARLAQESTAKAIDFTTKLAGAAGAVQSLTGALGVQGGAAGLLASMAASAAASAQLGGTFGPSGALVGGILGAAIPAISALSERFETAIERTQRLREETDRLRESMMAQRLEADIAGALADPSMAGAILGAVPPEVLQQQRALAAAQARELDADRSRLERSRQRDGLRREDTTLPEVEAELNAARQRMALLDQEIERRGALEAAQRRQTEATGRLTAVQSEQDLATQARLQASQRAEEAYQREQEAWERYNESILRGLQQEQDARQRLLDLITEQYEKQRSEEERTLRATLEAKAANERVDAETDQREEARLARALRRLEQDANERQESLDRQTEKREEELQTFSDLASGVSRSLVTAVSEIASGAKTSEEAFKGMLASFLAAIAEQALIKAAFEYADAVASAARQDWGGFASHIAAGIAFTGVAVATGAAAGAVSAPPGQGQQASSPDRVAANDGNYGRTMFVNNWNAPVVSAGTEADVGRTLDRLGRRAYQRYGRVAA
ncbi:hypothetical protein [Sandaracinus amylolyticus]|uniref:hypothetical protein n=1 Tax=Sandaracinus amylolyticus TaxID=927083 RepID=UPI001F21F41F|nr:hypothetical protein [Sandaracinus amylolyticus]UJR81492.1 Hypothetical protein I5071_35520 [Sandaracinus amylolyticus]